MSEMRPTLAVGYTTVGAFDPDDYVLFRTGDGVGYARRWDDDESPRQIAHALKQALERPGDVEGQPAVEPGYVQVDHRPTAGAPADPKALTQQLYRMAEVYNEQYAERPEHDGLHLADDHCSTYRPDDAPTPDEFIERHTGSEHAPDVDGPLSEFETLGQGTDPAGAPIEYVYVVPLDAAAMYADEDTPYWTTDRAGFKWSDEVLRRFAMLVEEKGHLWPSGAIALSLYPEYVVVHHRTESVWSPLDVAERVRRTLQRYNRYKPARELEDGDTEATPPLELQPATYVGALQPAGGGADSFIERNGLNEEDGEPRDPEPVVDAEADDAGGSAWSINPFGGN